MPIQKTAIGVLNSTEDGHVLNVNFDYLDWSTDNGTGKVFFADGTTAKTQLYRLS